MNRAGWINIEAKPGRTRWHYFKDQGTYQTRQVSLCGQIRLYSTWDVQTRHITEAGNCLTCAKTLKKKGGE